MEGEERNRREEWSFLGYDLDTQVLIISFVQSESMQMAHVIIAKILKM